MTGVHDLDWRTADFCSAGACVQVCDTSRDILLRDSKDEQGGQPLIRLSYEDFATFRYEVLNSPDSGHTACVSWRLARDRIRLAAKDRTVVLSFTTAEWRTFVQGLAAGNFTPRLISSPAA